MDFSRYDDDIYSRADYKNTDKGREQFISVTFTLRILSIKFLADMKRNILKFKKDRTMWVVEEYVKEEYFTDSGSYKVYELAVYKEGKRPELATKRTETDYNNFTYRGYKEIVTFRKA